MAAAQLLYLTSTASSVVSANASVAQMSLTPGAAATTGTGIANGTTLATWSYIPGTASTTTLNSPAPNPNSIGWILDATSPGSYATGVWSIDVATQNTSATGTAVDQFELWLVTATTTAVTKVSLITGTRTSSTYTPTLAATVHTTSSVSVTSFTVAANQYLYAEVYFKTNTAGTSGTAVQTLILDAPSAGATSHLTTPVFTSSVTSTTGTATVASSLTVATAGGTGLSTAASSLTVGAQATVAVASSISSGAVVVATGLTAATLGLNPGAYYRMNETAGVALTDSSTAALNGTYQATGVTYNAAPLTTNDAGSPLFDGSTGYA